MVSLRHQPGKRLRGGVLLRWTCSLAIISSFPVMVNDAIEMCREILCSEVKAPVLFGFVFLATLTAVNFSNFDVALTCVGGICCCLLSFVMPSLMLIGIRRKAPHTKVRRREYVVPSLVCILGLFFAALTFSSYFIA